ncbi:MAG: protein kinase [Polyangia bacterium]|jgi:serine/threonine protein kinase|nr:protein kinase [Polyangia bacterium]
MEETLDKRDLIGTLLAGRFRIQSLLGEGAMGQVFVAEHEGLGRKVAVKVLHQFVEDDPRLVERFRREARAASNLDHPNIVTITDFGRTEEDQLYLVMEYIHGLSLADATLKAAPGRLPFARVLSILVQICNAVDCAREAGVVHRDLKPENVLLGQGRSGQDVVKILDFGLAKMVDTPELSRLTRKGEVFGTPAYMSPEQARGDQVDHRSDLYSVGVMAYELLSGRLPFAYPSIVQLLRAHQGEVPARPSSHLGPTDWPIPADVEAMVMRCLEKNPNDRPSSLTELRRLLEPYLQRISLNASRIIPRVVLQQVTQEAEGNLYDCFEVTCEYTSTDAITATLLPELVPDEPLEPEILEEAPSEDQLTPENAPAPWYWSRVISKAKALAGHLREQRLGSVEITQALATLAELEDRTMGLETEMALAQSRIIELESVTREAESRLRHAVMDLSIERGRLMDEGEVGPQVIQDLDTQIRALEGRLAEVHRDQVETLAALEKAISARQIHVEHYQKEQTEAEARLLNVLHRVRPQPCPLDIAVAYDRIEELLRAMQNVQG